MNTIGIAHKRAEKATDRKGIKLLQRLVRIIKHGSFKSFTSQEHACGIMGGHFFGVEEAIKHFGVTPSKRELVTLADVPFSEKTLTMCKSTHILIAVFPLSILDIRSRVHRSLFSRTDFDIIKSRNRNLYYKDILLNEQTFANHHGTIGWHLVRKDSEPGSDGLSWSSQRRCLGINNKVPSARVLIYTIVGYYLSTGVRLFTALPHVRCSDRLSFGHGVVVSNWMEGDLIGVASGIGLSNYSRLFSDDRLGVASERTH